MDEKKEFSALPLEEQVKYLLWLKNTASNPNKFYEVSSISSLALVIGHMENQGFIEFHGNTAKDRISYITEKGLEMIKGYSPNV